MKKALSPWVAILFLFIATITFRHFVCERIVVSGESMEPCLQDGDVLWVRKYDIDNVQRNDVVTIEVQHRLLIKRVIGLPGETVELTLDGVYVDGVKLSDDVGVVYEEYQITLGDNEYFVLGDNRINSRDSREFGAVTIDQITGLAEYRFFPFWRAGYV